MAAKEIVRRAVRAVALSRRLPFRRFRYYGLPSIMCFFEGRRLLWRCCQCRRPKWTEEIINGCGMCDACWEHAFATDPVLNPRLRA